MRKLNMTKLFCFVHRSSGDNLLSWVRSVCNAIWPNLQIADDDESQSYSTRANGHCDGCWSDNDE